MNEKKRKQKQYYVNQAKRAKFEKRKLHPGLRGFLCTTNNKERECVREAYNLLNEYANQMYGAEHGGQEEAAAGSKSQDLEQSLEAELAALKEQNVSKERRFQQVESGAKNCIFISTQLEQTAPLVERIAREIRDTGTQRTRYLLRLIPVQVVCKATDEDIRASAESMIKEAFTEVGVSYTTVFKSRNQAQLTQTDAQTAINNLIDAVCPTARLDHRTPTLTVLMEVIRNVICLGVVRDYFQMRKYNLVELAKAGAGSGEGGEGSGEGEEKGDGEGEEKGDGEGEEGSREGDEKGDGEGNGEGAAESAQEEAAGDENGSTAAADAATVATSETPAEGDSQSTPASTEAGGEAKAKDESGDAAAESEPAESEAATKAKETRAEEAESNLP